MNWERYLELKRERHRPQNRFRPENEIEAKQALALGLIDIGQYVEYSLTLEPLLDSVHDPDPDVRKQAIRKIAEQRTPFSIRMLHNMLLDEDEEVRLYTASELDRLEGEMQKHIHQLRKKLIENPNQLEIRFKLAKAYIEYARLLLLDNNLRHFFLNKAVGILNRNIALQPNNPDYLFYRGWVYQMQGNYQKAITDLTKTIKLNKRFVMAFLILAEVYFELGEYHYVKWIMNVIPVKKQQVEEYNVHLYWKT